MVVPNCLLGLFGMSTATVLGLLKCQYGVSFALIIAIIFYYPLLSFMQNEYCCWFERCDRVHRRLCTPRASNSHDAFKTFGYITNNQAVTFVQDMKLGHYMKIDPRTLFWAQFVATIWGSLVQIAVLEWAYGAIDNLCAADQKSLHMSKR